MVDISLCKDHTGATAGHITGNSGATQDDLESSFWGNANVQAMRAIYTANT